MTMSSNRAAGGVALWLWLGLAATVIVLDQLSKSAILAQFQLGDSLEVTSFFNIVRAHNTGAAFSFMADASGWQRWFFVALGIAASAFILWLLKRHPAQTLFCFALTMILGGALGNVVDRLQHGYVVDFIQLHYAGLAFPSFNLADSAITLGAICLIADELRRIRSARRGPV
jgi:signal peptidase II